MSLKENIHTFFIWLLNLSVIFKLVSIAWKGNDKAVLVVFFGYSILISLNAILWLLFILFKGPERKVYKLSFYGYCLYHCYDCYLRINKAYYSFYRK